jgi:hypothetical protein
MTTRCIAVPEPVFQLQAVPLRLAEFVVAVSDDATVAAFAFGLGQRVLHDAHQVFVFGALDWV